MAAACHRSDFDKDLCDRLVFTVLPNVANRSLGRELQREEAHLVKVSKWNSVMGKHLIYTDGSLTMTRDRRFSGWGFATLETGSTITKMEKGAFEVES